ncbi:hypothetical protein ACR3I8_17850 [Priestia flexa]
MNSNHTIYKGKRLVLSAGTWSKELLAKLGLNLPATPIRKAFAWFKVDEKFYGESRREIHSLFFKRLDIQHLGANLF